MSTTSSTHPDTSAQDMIAGTSAADSFYLSSANAASSTTIGSTSTHLSSYSSITQTSLATSQDTRLNKLYTTAAKYCITKKFIQSWNLLTPILEYAPLVYSAGQLSTKTFLKMWALYFALLDIAAKFTITQNQYNKVTGALMEESRTLEEDIQSVPLSDIWPRNERLELISRITSDELWKQLCLVCGDLKHIHPEIAHSITALQLRFCNNEIIKTILKKRLYDYLKSLEIPDNETGKIIDLKETDEKAFKFYNKLIEKYIYSVLLRLGLNDEAIDFIKSNKILDDDTKKKYIQNLTISAQATNHDSNVSIETVPHTQPTIESIPTTLQAPILLHEDVIKNDPYAFRDNQQQPEASHSNETSSVSLGLGTALGAAAINAVYNSVNTEPRNQSQHDLTDDAPFKDTARNDHDIYDFDDQIENKFPHPGPPTGPPPPRPQQKPDFENDNNYDKNETTFPHPGPPTGPPQRPQNLDFEHDNDRMAGPGPFPGPSQFPVPNSWQQPPMDAGWNASQSYISHNQQGHFPYRQEDTSFDSSSGGEHNTYPSNIRPNKRHDSTSDYSSYDSPSVKNPLMTFMRKAFEFIGIIKSKGSSCIGLIAKRMALLALIFSFLLVKNGKKINDLVSKYNRASSMYALQPINSRRTPRVTYI